MSWSHKQVEGTRSHGEMDLQNTHRICNPSSSYRQPEVVHARGQREITDCICTPSRSHRQLKGAHSRGEWEHCNTHHIGILSSSYRHGPTRSWKEHAIMEKGTSVTPPDLYPITLLQTARSCLQSWQRDSHTTHPFYSPSWCHRQPESAHSLGQRECHNTHHRSTMSWSHTQLKEHTATENGTSATPTLSVPCHHHRQPAAMGKGRVAPPAIPVPHPGPTGNAKENTDVDKASASTPTVSAPRQHPTASQRCLQPWRKERCTTHWIDITSPS